jgi:hypothetical protein
MIPRDVVHSSRPRVEVFRGKGRIIPGWFYRYVAGNGQTLTVSESYVTPWNARRAAKQYAESFAVPVLDLSRKPRYRRFP